MLKKSRIPLNWDSAFLILGATFERHRRFYFD